MKINADRLWETHHQLAVFTEKNSPYTRRSFTPLYKKSREWLREEFLKLGLHVSVDYAGNLKALYKGKTDKQIGVGSHTDTVPGGGRFDGISGVLSFLEIAKVLKEKNFTPKKGILGIDFLAEEPSFFGISCVGSSLATGNFTKNMLFYKNQNTQETLYDAINEWGGDASKLAPNKTIFDTKKLKAYLELHIEQGRILEDKGLDVGIVRGICSVTRYDFHVIGQADHAGNTPMGTRKDALVAAAKLIDKISLLANKYASKKFYFTATVGKLELTPNGSNVVPKEVNFTLDARCEDNRVVESFLEELSFFAKEVEKITKTDIKNIKISQDEPAISDLKLVALLEKNAKKLNLKYTQVLSGAGHDAALMSSIVPMAMIFIPCKEGRSHVSTEFSSKEQIEKGANLLLSSLLELSS